MTKHDPIDGVPEGMFVFSNPVQHPEELSEWRKHFTRKGIVSQILATTAGTFVLCREGIEADHESAMRKSHKSGSPKQNVIRRLSNDRGRTESHGATAVKKWRRYASVGVL